jgi:hypothetical protein
MCGMQKVEWQGIGYDKDGEIYCCKGCAEGTGCTCKKEKPTPLKTEQEVQST